jgi:hypothetical protein
MRIPKVTLRVDEKSYRAARDRLEAEEALDQLGRLIVRSFVDAVPAEDLALLGPWLKTKAGNKAFRQSWPIIVDAYFQALCNPKR